jgi:hypothetical protein
MPVKMPRAFHIQRRLVANIMRRIRLSLVLAAAAWFILSGAPALAWNPPGHMTVALIAYEQLDAATKEKAVSLLRAHPRFADHFDRAMQREMRRASDAEKDQWVFAFAATWPDIVRSAGKGVTEQDVRQYNRPWWHFVDEPVYLSAAEAFQLEPTVSVNRRRDPPENNDDPNMNVIQAIKAASGVVGDKNAAAELRSVRLCWLLHLVGDSHQPLHSSALFTSHRFAGGDHGGNYLNYGHGYTLHSFWDDAISTEEPFATIRKLAVDLSHQAELAAEGENAAASLDPGSWIDEGHELAKKYAYSTEVLQKVADREGHTHLGDLNPSPQYAADAETVSERQAVIAGHRLAKLITQLLK